jgi:hypothetical protein
LLKLLGTSFSENLIKTLVFEKTANFFAENWQKIAENSNQNIDPWINFYDLKKFFPKKMIITLMIKKNAKFSPEIGDNR